MPRLCDVVGCSVKHLAKGLCRKHYNRKYYRGEVGRFEQPHFRAIPDGRMTHPLHGTYAMMLQRCTNVKSSKYLYYGARGITVCERWKGADGWLNFISDMGLRPIGTTLDRINNDGNYDPDNCRWATRSQQSQNRRIASNNKSGYTGVSWSKDAHRWRADIMRDGITRHLGYFTTTIEAKNAYDTAAIALILT